MLNHFKKLIAIAFLLPLISCAGELWTDLNLTSIHSKPGQHLNQVNYGAGVEYHAGHDVLYMTGAYRNSYYRTSVYALAGWTPISFGAIHIGALVGAINGYPGLNNGGITKAIAGLIGIEGEHVGTNLLLIPPALSGSPVTIGLQMKFKF